MYVSIINHHGREERINTHRLNFVLYDRGTLFTSLNLRPGVLTSDRYQAGKLITHLLADENFVDVRNGERGYLINLAALHSMDSNPRSNVIFIEFKTGTQVKLPTSKAPILDEALAAIETTVQMFSTRWQRVRFSS